MPPTSAGHAFFKKADVGYSDMIKLPDLEDAQLRDNLERRFRAEMVYTFIGDIVVSVNPFKRTGNADPEVQRAYVDIPPHRQPTELPPHIFCLVSQAYARMRSAEARSLSILISGESGAGKTEAMKLCVSHLGALSTSDAAGGAGGGASSAADSIASRLMKTNPVMEPIGNAKTVRNNNSSRFGKHFDIQFDPSGRIIGAATSVYLLEKPRICAHMTGARARRRVGGQIARPFASRWPGGLLERQEAYAARARTHRTHSGCVHRRSRLNAVASRCRTGERNYHVFYMLCKADSGVRERAKLQGWASYAYLSQAGTVERVTSWDDVQEFGAMHAALAELGFGMDPRGVDQRDQLYSMISIVLQLGNLRFEEGGESGGCVIAAGEASSEQLALTSGLLQVRRGPYGSRPPPSTMGALPRLHPSPAAPPD